MNRIVTALIVTAALSVASGARAEDKLYEIKKTEPKAAVGAKGTASVTLEALHGWHVNGEAPITLALTPPPGVTLPKTKLARADLAASTEESARFDVAFEASEVGTKVIPVEARFVICQGTVACKPVKETLSLNIDVAAAAAPEKAKPGKKAKPKKKA
ncbi:MAG TPA: hypothetical protein VHJ20_01860 [Polyangia bacterium]|nr:hypothetical protein [Polyangia bacterium]